MVDSTVKDNNGDKNLCVKELWEEARWLFPHKHEDIRRFLDSEINVNR